MRKFFLIQLILVVILISGCVKDVEIKYKNYDCYPFFDIYSEIDLSRQVDTLKSGDVNFDNLDFGDSTRNNFLYSFSRFFLNLDDEDPETYGECSETSQIYIKSLREKNENLCRTLPEKINVTKSSLGGIMSGHEVSRKNITVNYRDACLFRVLLWKKMEENDFCEKIPLKISVLKDTCFTDRAIENNNLINDDEFCNKLTHPLNKETCYVYFACKKNDEKWCDFLDDSESKNNCLGVLSRGWCDFTPSFLDESTVIKWVP